MGIIIRVAIAVTIANLIKLAYETLSPAGRQVFGLGLVALAVFIAVGVVVALAVDDSE